MGKLCTRGKWHEIWDAGFESVCDPFNNMVSTRITGTLNLFVWKSWLVWVAGYESFGFLFRVDWIESEVTIETKNRLRHSLHSGVDILTAAAQSNPHYGRSSPTTEDIRNNRSFVDPILGKIVSKNIIFYLITLILYQYIHSVYSVHMRITWEYDEYKISNNLYQF